MRIRDLYDRPTPSVSFEFFPPKNAEAEETLFRDTVPGLVVLSGMEVSCEEGHFLAYGIKDPTMITRRMHVRDLCKEIHGQGGVVVAAHPFRWGQPFEEILLEEQPELDGLEMMSSNMDSECRLRAAEVFARGGLAGTGSSDAHHEQTLGCCFTEFAAVIRDYPDLVRAIREQKSTPRESMNGNILR